MGKCKGISFVDSTTLKACHIKTEKQNNVFSGIATKGKAFHYGVLEKLYKFRIRSMKFMING
jgi:Transposase DDE domain